MTFIAWTMYQKFVQSVPLYRQEKDWKQMGFPLSRSTLSNWIIKTSEEWLQSVVEKLREELLKDKYLHADELCRATHNSSYVESFIMYSLS